MKDPRVAELAAQVFASAIANHATQHPYPEVEQELREVIVPLVARRAFDMAEAFEKEAQRRGYYPQPH